jgi:hypothetical protein
MLHFFPACILPFQGKVHIYLYPGFHPGLSHFRLSACFSPKLVILSELTCCPVFNCRSSNSTKCPLPSTWHNTAPCFVKKTPSSVLLWESIYPLPLRRNLEPVYSAEKALSCKNFPAMDLALSTLAARLPIWIWNRVKPSG